MNPKLPLLLFSLLPIGIASALPSGEQELLNEAPVLWEPVVRLSSGLPIRLTGAVHIIEKDQWQPFDQQLWTVQASIGF